jgi:hypothetical protein
MDAIGREARQGGSLDSYGRVRDSSKIRDLDGAALSEDRSSEDSSSAPEPENPIDGNLRRLAVISARSRIYDR